MLLGVATLSLSHSNLAGSIEALDLSALAVSLTRLDLTANQLSGGAGSLSTLTQLTFLNGGSNQCKAPTFCSSCWSYVTRSRVASLRSQRPHQHLAPFPDQATSPRPGTAAPVTSARH